MGQATVDVVIKGKDQASSKLAGFAKNLAKMGTAAVAAFAALEVKRFVDFEQKLSDISTLMAGDSTQAIGKMKDGILDLTKSVPKSADELGAAAYDIVSAGISDTGDALKVLEASSKLAVAGLGDTSESVDLMTSAMNSFNIPADQADVVANSLFETVKNGKTTVTDLAASFGKVAPVMAAAGVEFVELQAATAALTTTGQSASEAQTGLRAAVIGLNKPTAEMKTLFEKIGVESGEKLIKTSGGLVGAFKKIEKASDGDTEALAKAFGSVEAFNAVLGLTGPVAEAFDSTLADMNDGVDSMGEAFEKQKESVGNTFMLMKNQVEAFVFEGLFVAIEWIKANWPAVKKALIPVIDALKKAIDFLLPSLLAMWNTYKTNLLPTLKQVWRILGPIVKILGVSLVAAFWVVINVTNVFYKALAFGIKVFAGFVTAIMGGIGKVIRVVQGIPGWFSRVWHNVVDAGRVVLNFFKNLGPKIKGGVSKVGGIITAPFRTAFNAVANLWNGTVGKISFHAPDWVPGIGGKGFDVPDIPTMATGVKNFSGGLALVGEQGPEVVSLPQGSDVIPNHDIDEIGTSVSLNVNIGMFAGTPNERREIAQALFEDLADIAATKNTTAGEMLGLNA